MSKENVKLCFLITFNIVISLHFCQKFYWNSLSLSEDMNFYFFDFNYFCQFFGFFYLFTCYRKTDVSIYKIISAVFWLGIILNRLLKNCIITLLLLYDYINIGLVLLPILRLREGGFIDTPRIITLKKPSIRFIKLK